jgi:phosphoglycerol transferase MdoB-like AlkP superfamily enzyme
VFLVGALNYALMLGTLNLVVGYYPILPAIDLFRSELSFFLFIGFTSACYLSNSPKLLWTRRALVLVLATLILLLAHMAAVLAQITSEAGPMHKVLFYVNYIKSDWFTDNFFEILILYLIPGFLIFLLILVYRFCLTSDSDGPYLRQKFLRNFALAALFLSLGFMPPIQQQMPYSLSHNALLYFIKTGYVPQQDIYQHDDSDNYKQWQIKDSKNLNDKNIVLIILESTQKKVIKTHDTQSFADLTPFLKSLAKKSLVFEQAYGSVPHTSKALVSIHCGILPFLDLPIFESVYGLPTNCLPELLNNLSYKTVFMQGATAKYENRKELLKVFGYQEAYAALDLNLNGAERSNPLGFEDKALLSEVDQWLEKNKKENDNQKYLMSLLTLTSHSPYGVPKSFKKQRYLENDLENAYLNAIRYSDGFIQELMSLFKKKQQYENTIFIFVSDHGEAFGEHGEQLHNNVAYNEVAQVFFMIHDGSGVITQKEEHATVSQLQILPTIMQLLEVDIEGTELPKSVFEETGEAFGSCYERLMCFFYSDNNYKYIFNFREKTPELFDIKADPKEQVNLATEKPQVVQQMHEKLMAYYNRHQSAMHNYYYQQNPNFLTDISRTVLYSIYEMRASFESILEERQDQ